MFKVELIIALIRTHTCLYTRAKPMSFIELGITTLFIHIRADHNQKIFISKIYSYLLQFSSPSMLYYKIIKKIII